MISKGIPNNFLSLNLNMITVAMNTINATAMSINGHPFSSIDVNGPLYRQSSVHGNAFLKKEITHMKISIVLLYKNKLLAGIEYFQINPNPA